MMIAFRTIKAAAIPTWICVLILHMAFISPVSGFTEVAQKNKNPHIVFLISEDPDNYEAHRTIPEFAQRLREQHDFQVTVLLGEGPREAFHFPNLEVITQADLLIIFCRRVALPHAQLDLIKNYLKAGKPVVGLRTANHAFSVREDVHDGHQAWWDFVPEILGCENKGYGPATEGTDVAIVPSAVRHPVLKNVTPATWHSKGNVYLVSPLLDKNAIILLTGTVNNKVEPIAWTRKTEKNSRVFYTSLGYPDDFNLPHFCTFLINGIHWALNKK